MNECLRAQDLGLGFSVYCSDAQKLTYTLCSVLASEVRYADTGYVI